MRRLAAILWVVLGPVALSSGQSLNIDLDTFLGTEATGNGSPSAVFGAAANQPGFWNRVDAGGPVIPTTLMGLDGNPTPCQVIASGALGATGGFNNPSLSGDFRLLMADFADVGAPIHYFFSGFSPGQYTIYTFGATAQGTIRNLLVSVPGSSTPTQVVSGPMPANQFLYGIDYCAHELTLTGTSFQLDVTTDSPLFAQIHGFQIVRAVPEPTTIFILASGFASVTRRRRRSCR